MTPRKAAEWGFAIALDCVLVGWALWRRYWSTPDLPYTEH